MAEVPPARARLSHSRTRWPEANCRDHSGLQRKLGAPRQELACRRAARRWRCLGPAPAAQETSPLGPATQRWKWKTTLPPGEGRIAFGVKMWLGCTGESFGGTSSDKRIGWRLGRVDRLRANAAGS